MKIDCVKEQLLNALVITEKITGTNPTLPILKCVLLEVKGGTLTIRSTNLELGIEVTIPVKVEKEGVIAVPASIFYNTLQTTQDSSITLFIKENNLIIKTKHSNTHINTLENEDFPSLPVIKTNTVYTLKSDNLISGIQSVVYSASNSTIKPELSSVYVYENNKKIYFVSTDSFRLAEKQIPIKEKNTIQPFLLPIRNALELSRVLQQLKNNSDVSIKTSENQISFEVDNIFITSRIIDGVFPDYGQIIPKEINTEVVVLKQDLLTVFKKINIFTDRFGQVSLKINTKQKTVLFCAQNNTVGETTDSIDAVIKGDDVDMKFNYRYIFDCLTSIHSDSIKLNFSGVGRPLIIKGVSDESFLYLVMPMNK